MRPPENRNPPRPRPATPTKPNTRRSAGSPPRKRVISVVYDASVSGPRPAVWEANTTPASSSGEQAPLLEPEAAPVPASGGAKPPRGAPPRGAATVCSMVCTPCSHTRRLAPATASGRRRRCPPRPLTLFRSLQVDSEAQAAAVSKYKARRRTVRHRRRLCRTRGAHTS